MPKTDKATDLASRGGKARAESLSPEEKRNIARKAAQTRWNAEIPKASCEGEFKIGETTIKAAVLPNGKRLLAQATFLRALGRSRSPKAGTGVLSTVDGLPFFLQADTLKPFITEDLAMSTTPIFFCDMDGRRQVGYDAELLPMVAEVYLKMRDQHLADGGEVPKQYEHIVQACDIIMRGLARVGIIALVDEATGYQDERARNALATILEQFVHEELRKWVKTFPVQYYQELCRLRGVPFAANLKLPRYFGHLTNDIIYSRLAPGVLDELRRVNPSSDGKRKAKHFQHLTEDVGNPKLLQHLGSVVTLMKLSSEYDQFKETLDKIHPVHRALPLFDHLDQDD